MDLSYHAALMLSRLQQKYPNSDFTIKDMKKSCVGYMDDMSKTKAVNELLSTFLIQQVGSEYSEKLQSKVCDWLQLSETGKSFVIKIGR